MKFGFLLAGAVALALGWPQYSSAGGPGLHATSVVRIDSRNGRLVRRVIGPSLKTAGTGAPAQSRAKLYRDAAHVDQLVEEAARKHQVDPLLIHSVIEVESNYNPFAVSEKGAAGLMQLIPSTAKRFGVKNSFDPEQNIDAGVRYLKILQDAFEDDRLALAAYNAGEGAIIRHQWIPPYPETREYVRRVGLKYAELKKKAEKEKGSGSPDRLDGDYRPLVSFVDSQGRLHLRTR